MKKYFGTDGIRGVYGKFLTDEIAYFTGNYIGKYSQGKNIAIGRDTRPSGPAILDSLAKGITDAGANVVDLGVISTPAVSFVAETHETTNFGIVISASHNPKEYNGIKIFNNQGRKLIDEEEAEIEDFIDQKEAFLALKKGTVTFDNKLVEDYEKLLKKTADFNLEGIKVAIDCSNGATSGYAKRIFEELGATVYSYFDEGDGENINNNCGALYPEVVAKKALEVGADIAFSFDGDADRIIAVDKNGKTVDGDSIIYIVGCYLKNKNKLSKDSVVGTKHTNMGVEHSLKEKGIKLFRTDIGDHYVMEKLLEDDLLVGGEQSGHIILREFINTGDGLLTALYLSKICAELGKGLEDLDDSKHYPQININVISEFKDEIMKSKKLDDKKCDLEEKLVGKGRILLRKSGTEPKIRIMVECDDHDFGLSIANELKATVEEIIKSLS